MHWHTHVAHIISRINAHVCTITHVQNQHFTHSDASIHSLAHVLTHTQDSDMVHSRQGMSSYVHQMLCICLILSDLSLRVYCFVMILPLDKLTWRSGGGVCVYASLCV